MSFGVWVINVAQVKRQRFPCTFPLSRRQKDRAQRACAIGQLRVVLDVGAAGALEVIAHARLAHRVLFDEGLVFRDITSVNQSLRVLVDKPPAGLGTVSQGQRNRDRRLLLQIRKRW